jgi:hypothetical protein
MNDPIHKLVAITTDGTRDMTNENNGFSGTAHRIPFLKIFSVTTVHKKALCM